MRLVQSLQFSSIDTFATLDNLDPLVNFDTSDNFDNLDNFLLLIMLTLLMTILKLSSSLKLERIILTVAIVKYPFPKSKSLLAPTGALILMMVRDISVAAPAFSDFHSVHWCYKCHSN